MANNHNDGGAAFPRPGFADNETESQEGMTLRDYFAGQALAGMMEQGFIPSMAADARRKWDYAKAAYLVADAMIKARGE